MVEAQIGREKRFNIKVSKKEKFQFIKINKDILLSKSNRKPGKTPPSK